MEQKNSITREEFDREHMAVYRAVLDQALTSGHTVERAILAANRACDDFEARFLSSDKTNDKD